MELFGAMLGRLGPSGWWPAQTPFEVAVGAILTQNTNWQNVEKAIEALRSAGGLTEHGLASIEPARLEQLIRPAGFFRQKAAKLRGLEAFLQEHANGILANLALQPMEEIREKLLSVKGIGPETADSILLYALDKPSFVVDAYTKRILTRHGLLPEDVLYDEMREFFMDVLPADVPLFNEYHALLVRVAKEWCHKSAPKCDECPLGSYLEYEVAC